MGVRDRLAGFGRGLVRGAVSGVAESVADWGSGYQTFTDWANGYQTMDPMEKAQTGTKQHGAQTDDGSETLPGGGATGVKTAPVPTDKQLEDPHSLFFDPFSVVEQLGFKERHTNVSFGTLKSMVNKMPIIAAIHQTRIAQVASFAHPQHDRYQMGFRIKSREAKHDLTDVERREVSKFESMIMQTGVTENSQGRDSFETFLKKVTKDSLRYDQLAAEIVPNKKGLPCDFYAVDAASIRLADSASTYIHNTDEEATRYVQVYDGQVVATYPQRQMMFGVRNPRTDLMCNGYGESELEMLVKTITALLWGWEYNLNAFSQGSVQKGVINLKGTVSDKNLKSFRRQWYTQLQGVRNAWKTPIVNSEGLEWHNLMNNNRDMEYNAWIDFQIKVACSVYLIDPAEINFKYGNSGQSSTMTEDSNSEKITASQERGLRPILRFLAQEINQSIIWPINPSFEFEFVGLDSATKDEVAELNTKRVKTFVTVNEVRKEEDLKPLPPELGDIILDPVFIQNKQNIEGTADQGEDGQEDGQGNDEGQGNEDDYDFESLLNEGDDDKDVEKSMRKGSVRISGSV